jgi:hypothetical protein
MSQGIIVRKWNIVPLLGGLAHDIAKSMGVAVSSVFGSVCLIAAKKPIESVRLASFR